MWWRRIREVWERWVVPVTRRIREVWERWVVPVTLTETVVAAAMVLVGDQLYDRTYRHNFSGLFDWTAHLGTSLLILNLLPQRWRRPILAPALIFSVIIDADHIPQRLFHSLVLTEGTPRPYTHSWVTPAAALLIALLWPRRRAFWIGAAVGLCLHFFRDLAEEPGSGVSLLWPFSDHAYVYSHSLYLLIMAGILGLNLIRWLPSPRAHPSADPARAAGARLPDREALHHAGSVPPEHQRAASGRQPVDQP